MGGRGGEREGPSVLLIGCTIFSYISQPDWKVMSVILLDRTGTKVWCFGEIFPECQIPPLMGPARVGKYQKRVPGKAREVLIEVANCSGRRVS